MRVLLVEPDFNSLFVNFANELARRKGVEVHYLAREELKKGLRKGSFHGVHVHTLTTTNILIKLLHLPTYLLLRFVSGRARAYYAQFPEAPLYRGLRKEMDAIRPDIVIVNPVEFIYSFQVARFCRKNGIRYYVQSEMHSPAQTAIDNVAAGVLRSLIRRRILPSCSRFFCWTKQGEDFWKRRLSPEEGKKVALLPAGVDGRIFKRRESTHAGRTRRFLVIARLVKYKDHATVIAALRMLKERTRERFTCTFLGEGPLEGEIRQQIRENGLTGIITLKKPVQYREIPDVYASHDCLVLASRNEAIGMVVPEALACGIPCIVPDTGGPSTYITHGKNGLVFRTGDPASLGAALQRMLEEREYRRMQEEAARGRERLLWRSVVTGLLGMMEEKG